MRILIEHANGQGYFDGEKWNLEAGQAMDFESTTAAERFCLERRLAQALVVVRFLNPEVGDIRFAAGARASTRDFSALNQTRTRHSASGSPAQPAPS